jgi:nucleoside 2-deoxyribosyltransferase
MNSNGRCCIFQPFDKGPHDKRYEDTIAPAIRAAELEPYRVDRDDGAVIPVETLHDEIRVATLCLADITTRNPNVMYELGYAIASGKDVVIICATQQAAFPFDIQHRGIIQYALDSASDFEQLKAAITNRIKAFLKKQVTTNEIVTASPVKSTHGLQPSEIAALALVMANGDSSDQVTSWSIKQDMFRAGYTALATRLALTQLARMGFIETREDSDNNGNTFLTYQMLVAGEDWLLQNQNQLELRSTSKKVPPPSSADPFAGIDVTADDVPF